MKGLLLKDIYTLKSTLRTYIFFAVFYGIMSFSMGDASFVGGFMTIMLSMVPITALAYDERAKWDKFALTMPVTKKDLVISKYILGFVLSLVGFVISISALMFQKDMDMFEKIIMSIVFMSLGWLYQGLVLPLMYKFGTEKGRIYMMMVFFLPSIAVYVITKFVDININPNMMETLLMVFPFIAFAIFIASAFISMAIYNKKQLQ